MAKQRSRILPNRSLWYLRRRIYWGRRFLLLKFQQQIAEMPTSPLFVFQLRGFCFLECTQKVGGSARRKLFARITRKKAQKECWTGITYCIMPLDRMFLHLVVVSSRMFTPQEFRSCWLFHTTTWEWYYHLLVCVCSCIQKQHTRESGR